MHWGVRIALVLMFTFVGLVAHPKPGYAQSGSMNPMGPGAQMQPEPKPLKRVPQFGPREKIPLVDVHLIGLTRVPEARVRTMLQTRQGRYYDPEQVQRDVRTLIASGLFRDVNTYKEQTPNGTVITFELFERPVMQHVRFVGNEKIKDKALLKELGFEAGDPLNRFTVEEGRRRIERLYDEKGFQDTSVAIREGIEADDVGVVYEISEGQVTRILSTTFEGNEIASDARLRTQIKTKPGFAWLLGGKFDDDQFSQDIDRLTAYYRNLGYFRARVEHEISLNVSKKWAKVKFLVDEGPRYRVRSIQTRGNRVFDAKTLLSKIETRQGEFVNLGQMQRDLVVLRDEYGSQGFIFADIKAQPIFDEEPGQLDVIFDITEGEQYRVGQIFVNIDGQQASTRRNVVLNRLSINPGDLVDVREIRKSERRLQASQLFETNPAQGEPPKIVVKPPSDDVELARNQGSTTRGQSPGQQSPGSARLTRLPQPHIVQRPVVDLDVNVTMRREEHGDEE